MTTPPEHAAEYASNVADTAHGQHLLQRAYMAGALAALAGKAPRDQGRR